MSKPATPADVTNSQNLNLPEGAGSAPVSGVPVEPGFSSAGATEKSSSEVTIGPGGAELEVDRRRASVPPVDGVDRRTKVTDRRAAVERRTVDIGSPTGLERRRGPGRRRTEERRSAEEGNMSDEQFEFVLAIDTYKRLNNRPFPSWTEILEVIKQLGYRKVAASTLNLPGSQAGGSIASASAPTPPSDFMPG